MWNRDSERLSQNYLIILCLPGTIQSATEHFFATYLSSITWELSQRESGSWCGAHPVTFMEDGPFPSGSPQA